MRKNPRFRRVFLPTVLAVMILSSGAVLQAQQVFGDISLEPLDTPVDSANTLRGYAEYRFRLANESASKRVVELIAPFSDAGIAVPTHLDRVVRRVEAGPRANLVVSLLQPPLMLRGGGRVRVRVDGRDFEDPLTFSPGHSANFVDRINFLASRAARPLEFPLREAHQRRVAGAATATSGRSAPRPPGGASFPPIMLTVAGQPVRNWSANWLFYSRFEGLLVTSEDLLGAPPPVRQAIYEYAALGGMVLLWGPLPAWPEWPGTAGTLPGSEVVYPGFGVIIAAPPDSVLSADSPLWEFALERARETREPLFSPLRASPPHFITLIGSDIRLPVRGLFFVTVLFAILLGPANLLFLHRKKRRVWLWWTVPATALAATGLLTGFALFVEGSQNHVRTRSITILDERNDQAFTLGDQGYFSTRTPSGGLLLSGRTEAVPLTMRQTPGFYRSLRLDQGLRLEQGWVTARIPAHFQIRKAERRRERLPVRITSGGRVEITNGLGAPIGQMWFCAVDGSVHWGRNIAPGESSLLSPSGRKLPGDYPSAAGWRDYYTTGWQVDSYVSASVKVLRPGTYMAILSDSPFVETGIPQVSHPDRLSLVYGISTLSPPAADGPAEQPRGEDAPGAAAEPSGGER